MRSVLTAAAALVSLSSLPALAQPAGQTIDVGGGWKVTRVHNADGSFVQCNSALKYDDNTILVFAATAAAKTYVVMVDPAFKFTVGQLYKTEFYIDKAAPTPVDAVATEVSTLVIEVVKDEAFLAAATAGNNLFIDVAGQIATNPLAGSGKAITQLGTCVVAGMKGT